jgi:hypothetical protein
MTNPFPDLTPVPANMNLSFVVNQANTKGVPQNLKLVPKTSSGAVWDASNMTAMTLYLDNGQPIPFNTLGSLSVSGAVGSSTGISYSLTSANLTNLLEQVITTAGRITATVTDGNANEVVVGSGTFGYSTIIQ